MSSDMEAAIEKWMDLEGSGNRQPSWCTGDVRSIRFSNTVARELARLITLSIDIKVDEAYGTDQTARGMQAALDGAFLAKSQEVLEKCIRMGGVMAKWNGEGMDYLTPDRFLVTDYDSNGAITGAVFFTYYAQGKLYYTRAEYHRYTEGKTYQISNKAFVSERPDDIGRQIGLDKTKWADIEPETTISNLERPLFTYLKNPCSNTVDPDSPLGVSLFNECLEELRWLDIAISMMGVEQEESQPIMFVDNSTVQYAVDHALKLPKFVKGMDLGVSPENTIQQWQPVLQVESRKEAINFYLSIISYKCGFDAGYFIFNGQNIEMATATQVEATERRVVDTVLSYRNLLERPNANGDGRVGFVHDLAYIISSMDAASGRIAPTEFGNYQIYCDFADLTENREENKAFDYQLTMQGFMSKVRFLVRNLGLTEDEAQKMVQEAQQESAAAQQAVGGLFPEGE